MEKLIADDSNVEATGFDRRGELEDTLLTLAKALHYAVGKMPPQPETMVHFDALTEIVKRLEDNPNG